MDLLLARLLFFVLAAPGGGAAPAEEVYARIPLPALELTSGELPEYVSGPWGEEQRIAATWPYAMLEGGGEIYFHAEVHEDFAGAQLHWHLSPSSATVALKLDAPRDAVGTLFLPEEDGRALRRLEFRVPAASFSMEGREAFLRAKAEYYERLLARDLPGAAWFRYQGRSARKALGEELRTPPWRRRASGALATGDLDETFELFGGGRAIAENLQLDRELPFGAESASTVDIASIAGVETAAYDWTKEIAGLEPELDPLAPFIPADQYAAFFPSVEALSRTLDELEEMGNPVLSLAERRAENARTRERYQRQLCLPIDDPASPLRRIPITQIAVTGTDPFYRTGTDVTVLFATPQADELFAFLKQGIEAARRSTPSATALQVSAQEANSAAGVFTPDRELSCRVQQLSDNVLLVSNRMRDWSIRAVAGSVEIETLADAPEYVFFRDRYRRDEQGEEGLLVLTDAALRRWVGPRLRIGASRRTQAAAWLADAQCAKLAFDSGDTEAVLPRGLPDGSELVWNDDGARSERWGTTTFLTPIAELDLVRVTPAERDSYERFRQRYQGGWRAWFDPIAVRLVRRGSALEADVTVRPLIGGSDYREWMDVVGEARLAPDACDPHAGALGQFAMALDTRSQQARFVSSLLVGAGPEPLEDALDWIGGGLGVYAEPDDELMAGWRAAKSQDEEDLWLEEHLGQLPLALHVESKSPVKLALFMTSLRALVEQSAPDLLRWSTQERDGHSLVEVRASIGDAPFSIWYATLPEALIVTLREDVLLAAIQRTEARRAGTPEATRTWQGESLALRLDGALLRWIRDLMREETLLASQSIAWSTLPILREYRQRFPERDPFALHAALFGVHLEDPAGGPYFWDGRWSSYSSSLYGHPGAPIEGPSWPLALERLQEIDFGVTFESDGLRARAALRRD
jgi:hypothetical protein